MVGTNPFRPICLSACLRTSNQNPFSYSGHQRELKKRKRKEREKREEKKKKKKKKEKKKKKQDRKRIEKGRGVRGLGDRKNNNLSDKNARKIGVPALCCTKKIKLDTPK